VRGGAAAHEVLDRLRSRGRHDQHAGDAVGPADEQLRVLDRVVAYLRLLRARAGRHDQHAGGAVVRQDEQLRQHH
jgi:hypothetical protein